MRGGPIRELYFGHSFNSATRGGGGGCMVDAVNYRSGDGAKVW